MSAEVRGEIWGGLGEVVMTGVWVYVGGKQIVLRGEVERRGVGVGDGYGDRK